jgi:hypothetical protein
MDSVIDINNSLNWPIGPYVYRRNIGPDQLGIYGWTGEEYDKVFSPVLVRQTDSHSAIENFGVLKIRTVLDLTHFRWSMFPPDESICHFEPELAKFQMFDGDMTAGSVIEIEVPYREERSQFRCLELQYRPDNRRWKSEILRLGF